jgi:hypothetical protein
MPPRLREAKRWPGSEWLKDHPSWLERVYVWTKRLVEVAYPALKRMSPAFATRVMIAGERVSKGYAFNCQMCGQCILHSTGMTCPMTCPKNLRNGPCGGVRPDGRCEVIPERPCVWVQAWERSKRLVIFTSEIQVIQPPVNRSLQGTSAWANMVDGVDALHPRGWPSAEARHD